MNLSEKKFFVIAHRGASAYFPENTMSAFRAAVSMDVDMIELDVLLSKDKVPVVFHDEILDQKTNGSGLVSDYTLSDLQELDAGSWFSKKFKNERIPTLKKVLEYSKNKVLVNIEIKPEAVTESENSGIVELVLNLVSKLEMESKVLISSFDYRVLERVKKSGSDVKAAILYEPGQANGRTPKQLLNHYSVDVFNLSQAELTESRAQQLRNQKIPFLVYTVNDKEHMKSIINSGAKGIFTDRPDVLIGVVEEMIKKKMMV